MKVISLGTSAIVLSVAVGAAMLTGSIATYLGFRSKNDRVEDWRYTKQKAISIKDKLASAFTKSPTERHTTHNSQYTEQAG